MQVFTQCIICKHFIDDGTFSCAAYDYIPDEIVSNEVMHDKVLDGQKGNAIFKVKEGEEDSISLISVEE